MTSLTRKAVVLGLLTVGLLLVIGAPSLARDASGNNDTKKSSESDDAKATDSQLLPLLKDLGMPYFKLGNGQYKVLVSPGTSSKTVTVIVNEAAIGDVPIAYLFVQAVDVPDGYEHPVQMLKKIALLNDDFFIGKVSVNEKSGDIFYCSGFWLKSATSETLQNELEVAFYLSQHVAEELEPFVKEQ